MLHAYPSDPTVFNNLLSRAATIDNQALQLPPRSQVDQAILDKNSTILQKLTGKPAQQITTIPPVVTKVDPSTGKRARR